MSRWGLLYIYVHITGLLSGMYSWQRQRRGPFLPSPQMCLGTRSQQRRADTSGCSFQTSQGPGTWAATRWGVLHRLGASHLPAPAWGSCQARGRAQPRRGCSGARMGQGATEEWARHRSPGTRDSLTTVLPRRSSPAPQCSEQLRGWSHVLPAHLRWGGREEAASPSNPQVSPQYLETNDPRTSLSPAERSQEEQVTPPARTCRTARGWCPHQWRKE